MAIDTDHRSAYAPDIREVERVDSPTGPSPVARRGRTGWTARIPHWLAVFFYVVATISLVLSIIPALARKLATPAEWISSYVLPIDGNVAWAVFMALLASGLAARKRVAWGFTLGLMVLLGGLNVLLAISLTGDAEFVTEATSEWLQLITPAIIVIALLVSRPEFTAHVRRGALRMFLLVLVLGMVLAAMIAWALISLWPGTVIAGDHLGWAVDRVTGGWLVIGALLVPAGDSALLDFLSVEGSAPAFIEFLGGVLGGLAFLAAILTLFRSQTRQAELTPDDEVRVRNLLAEYGSHDSLGYFATRRDKLAIFAPNGRAAISYRVQGGVSLASGDPVGDPQAWPQAIAAWQDEARVYGWPLAVMGASEAGATAFNRAGLGAIQLGDEAILDGDDFDLAEMKPVRQAVNRAEKAGIAVKVRRHRDLGPTEMAAALAMADAWRDTEEERGFSMALGRLGDPNDGDCVLVQAFDADGTPLGVLSLSPWGVDGASLDLMRRNPKSPNGTMEMMVAELMRQGVDLGVRRVSLNFAVFRSAFEEGARIGAGPILRLWRGVLLFFSRWWQLEALYRSNVKYHPRWYPRFLCYSDIRNLARISLASGMAEGYVNVPFSDVRKRERDAAEPIPALAGVTPILSGGSKGPSSRRQRQQPDQVRVRFEKAQRLVDAGIDPYPVAMFPTHTVAATADLEPGTTVRLSGRLLLLRDHGGVVFAKLRDWSGDLQFLMERDTVGAQRMRAFTAEFDLGDLVEVSGTIGASRSGERSLLVGHWRLIGKCLRPLPDKYRGLTDPEARVRNRYVDLAISSETRSLTRQRSAAVWSLRESLVRRGFLEVETPILQQVHGGANARPFTTHINAYDLDLYLRIAPELYLKRLCVGGMDKVFEMGRTFRNEGADFKHNPEFTILEAYEAHSDYDRCLVLVRELIQEAAMAAHGEQIALRPDANGKLVPFDISGEWTIKTLHGAVAQALGEEVTPATELPELRRLCDRAHVPYRDDWDAGEVALEMYEHLVEDQTQAPTFYKDFPLSVSPLTKSHRSIPGVTERWDLVAWGVELGTAYSELTDPIEQRRRLTEQSLLAAGGDPEAMELDEDFLSALEYAMPPTGGLGMGVDRVVMLLTGKGIRETLPFPLARLR